MPSRPTVKEINRAAAIAHAREKGRMSAMEGMRVRDLGMFELIDVLRYRHLTTNGLEFVEPMLAGVMHDMVKDWVKLNPDFADWL